MKKLTSWISISSIALIVLGLIHLIATIMILPMFQNLGKEQFYIFLFMYLAVGLGTILPGLISKLMVNGLKNKDKGAWGILIAEKNESNSIFNFRIFSYSNSL